MQQLAGYMASLRTEIEGLPSPLGILVGSHSRWNAMLELTQFADITFISLSDLGMRRAAARKRANHPRREAS